MKESLSGEWLGKWVCECIWGNGHHSYYRRISIMNRVIVRVLLFSCCGLNLVGPITLKLQIWAFFGLCGVGSRVSTCSTQERIRWHEWRLVCMGVWSIRLFSQENASSQLNSEEFYSAAHNCCLSRSILLHQILILNHSFHYISQIWEMTVKTVKKTDRQDGQNFPLCPVLLLFK